MPLTPFQKSICAILSTGRTEDSYLAGGAALNFSPNSKRFSNDLDYFHDSVARVAQSFSSDASTLEKSGFEVSVEMNQPGYVRALVQKDAQKTKIEWAHDSAWRYMPTIRTPEAGYQLHPVDLAVNKVLALAGRDEPRDVIDTLNAHTEILSLGGLVWAAVGKDPGFTPSSLLELIKRRGRVQPDDLRRLSLASPIDLKELKKEWLDAISSAQNFIAQHAADEVGCLFFDREEQRFVAPDGPLPKSVVPHFGRPGGVLPTAARD